MICFDVFSFLIKMLLGVCVRYNHMKVIKGCITHGAFTTTSQPRYKSPLCDIHLSLIQPSVVWFNYKPKQNINVRILYVYQNFSIKGLHALQMDRKILRISPGEGLVRGKHTVQVGCGAIGEYDAGK